MGMTFNFLGNRYKSVSIIVPAGTNNYSVMENNSDTFTDWNENWDDRDYWTIGVIKDIEADTTEEPSLLVKFHSEEYENILLKESNTPAIFEPFVFRDIFITNENLYDVNVNIIVFNNRTINPPPYKPENLIEYEIGSSYVKIQFTDPTVKNESFNEKYFRIERSTVSPTTGFSQIGTATSSSLRFQNENEKIIYTDDTTTIGNTYWYRVRSYNEEGGNSPYSNVIEVNT
jgi:hypothetical protein